MRTPVDPSDLKVGSTYLIVHSRKGSFKGTVQPPSCGESWVVVIVTEGLARAIYPEYDKGVGEEVVIRADLCKFFEA